MKHSPIAMKTYLCCENDLLSDNAFKGFFVDEDMTEISLLRPNLSFNILLQKSASLSERQAGFATYYVDLKVTIIGTENNTLMDNTVIQYTT